MEYKGHRQGVTAVFGGEPPTTNITLDMNKSVCCFLHFTTARKSCEGGSLIFLEPELQLLQAAPLKLEKLAQALFPHGDPRLNSQAFLRSAYRGAFLGFLRDGGSRKGMVQGFRVGDFHSNTLLNPKP